MEKININYTKTIRDLGIAYLGGYTKSAKMTHSFEHGTVVYCLYLAPANMSGYNVCPCNKFCRKFCLNGSGRNKADILINGAELSRINRSRVKRTKLFFENKDLFMRLLIAEIVRTQKYARKMGMGFAVRLNGTSDISPEDFVFNGKNILQLFPDVQFYDYTKVFSRIDLINKYSNYDLTYSYNGYNMGACKKFLNMGGKVAVVFENQEMLPMAFAGYPVIDGNDYDMRYLDPKQTIIGLKYHRVAANYDRKGNYMPPTDPFVVKDNDEQVEWFSE